MNAIVEGFRQRGLSILSEEEWKRVEAAWQEMQRSFEPPDPDEMDFAAYVADLQAIYDYRQDLA